MLTDDGRAEIMKFHALGMLPALATNFTVCNRWFSSVPGPTWTNRLFLMSGTSLGRVNMPNGVLDLNLHWYDQPTIFDRLNERSISWRVYHGDTPLSLLLVHQWEPQNADRYKPMNQFYKDAIDADSFPAFVFIEPAYLDPGANDDHPAHDVLAGGAIAGDDATSPSAQRPPGRAGCALACAGDHGGRGSGGGRRPEPANRHRAAMPDRCSASMHFFLAARRH